LIEGVLASFAQFDNDVRSDRTRAGMRAALELGRWTFPAPIGYLNAPKWSGKSLVPDPERAPLIARAFEELATGRFTKQEVIARMTEAGLRTRRGLVFSPQSFGQMVRNSIYVGRVESPDYGVSPRGDFEPLIDEATFYRAQAVLIAASSWPVRDSAITRTSRCADSCAAGRAAGRSPAAGRRAGTATTRITTVSVNGLPNRSSGEGQTVRLRACGASARQPSRDQERQWLANRSSFADYRQPAVALRAMAGNLRLHS
jgi:hypothetical protein